MSKIYFSIGLLTVCSIVIAGQTDFCPNRSQMPANIELNIYEKEVGGSVFVVVATRNTKSQRNNEDNNQVRLEARRKIIEHNEGKRVGEHEKFKAEYIIKGLETINVECRRVSLTLFVVNKENIQRLDYEKNNSNDIQIRQPDPFKSAEENILDMMRIRN
jgi:hypothetical protein